MNDSLRILVVAATTRELATVDDERCRTLCCGVGPVEAATAVAAAIAVERPSAIVHVGIAGARRACALVPPSIAERQSSISIAGRQSAISIVIGTESRYCDLPETLPAQWAARTIITPPALVAAAQRAVPSAVALPIGTSARVGGTSACDVEAMEGFGVLRAAQRAGIPAIEVRAISNDIEEVDRARWQFEAAFAAITAITPRLVTEVLLCVN
jgi:hypothetical protein